MSVDDAEVPTRRQLERIAFGRAHTPDELAAARNALEELSAQDAAAAEAAREPVVAEPEPVAQLVDSPAPSLVDVSPRPLPSRLALLVIAGLLVGGFGGVLLAHAQSGAVAQISADATGRTPSPAPTADAALALKSLLIPQTGADKKFPLTGTETTLNIQPASIHRILTVADGATLWTSRTDTDICMMWSGSSRDNGSTGGVACSTPTAFADGGLSLTEGLITWTWDGTTFITTGVH
jgi:hypothetical protein